MFQAVTCRARSSSPFSIRSSRISLLAISTQVDLSTMGVSRSSSWVWRAGGGGGGAPSAPGGCPPAGRVARAGVGGAGGVGGGRGSADAAGADLGGGKGRTAAVVLGNHGAGEVEGGAGDVRVDVTPARKNDQTGRINGSAAIDIGNNLAV